MNTENLSTLKIHKLAQEQYDREVANGTIDETALYLTPDEKTVGKSVEGETFIVDDIEIIAGNGAEVFNDYSYNIATGDYSHAEGAVVHAVGNYSHAEGLSTIASGDCSHAEGNLTAAEGACSHAEGECTVASGSCQHVQGKYNIVDSNFAHIVGNGRVGNLSNAHTIDWDGNAWYAGGITVNGRINGLALSPINDTEVANKKYVDDNISNIIEQIEQLQEDKANKSGLTLGVHTDGLVYLFIDGTPHGNGLDIQTSVIEGDVFGYVDENNVVVLNGALADGTYTIKYEMDDGSTINIGNLVLDDNVYYSVTNALTNCTISNSATQVAEGESYSATITAKTGYELKSIVVKMGGTDISSTVVSGGKITISNVTGNIVITAAAEEVQTAEPTNFAEPNTANKTDINIWCNDARLGSGGTHRVNTGTVVTNFIPFTGDILYVDGMSIKLTGSELTNSLSFWDANKGFIAYGAVSSYTSVYGLIATQDADGAYTFDFSNFSLSPAGITTPYAYIRVCGALTGTTADVVINVKRNGEWL